MHDRGDLGILMGELASNATDQRTAGNKEVAAKHPDIKIIEQQPADYNRNKAIDLVSNWLTKGDKFAGIAANNDEMAIGAIFALQQAGQDPKKICIGGIDATEDALDQMKKGNLAVTVFQDAKGSGPCRARRGREDGQGRGDAALRAHPLRTGDAGEHEGFREPLKRGSEGLRDPHRDRNPISETHAMMTMSLVTDILGGMPFEEMLDTVSGLGFEALELGCGNWSKAPHLRLDDLLESEAARTAYRDAIARRGLSIAALNCSGNPLHPGDSGRQHAAVVEKTFSAWPRSSA